jgi:membrane protein
MTKQSRTDLGSKTPEIKTEKRKAVGGDCKESNIEGKSARKYSRRWDIIVTAFDFVTNFSESSISAYAGQAAFFLMLSFFPFLLFFFSLLSWTPLTEADFLMWASSFIPESFGDIMKDLASEVYASGTGRLSITMITAVYLSSKAFISFQLGLDDMYHVKENRNFILRRIYSVLYSIVFALALIFLLGIMVFGNMLNIKRSTNSTTSLLKLRRNTLKSCIFHQRNHSRSSKHIHRTASHSLRCLIQSHCNLFLTFNTCL